MTIPRYTKNEAKQLLRKHRCFTPGYVLAEMKYAMDRHGLTASATGLTMSALKNRRHWEPVVRDGLDMCVMLVLTSCSKPGAAWAHDSVDIRADLFEVYGMLEEAYTHILFQRDDELAWWMGKLCHRTQYLFKKYKLGEFYKPGKPKVAESTGKRREENETGKGN